MPSPSTRDRVALATTEPFDALGYIRVSTPQQAEPHKSSLRDQEGAVREMSEALGRRMGRIYCDAGISGAAVNRPAMLDLLAACEASPRDAAWPGVILALNASRWGRFEHPVEDAALRFRLRQVGWTVGFVEGDNGPLTVPPPLSADVAQRVARFFEACASLAPDAVMPMLTPLLAEFLADAATDGQATSILRLIADVQGRRSGSALMRVLAGRLDLLALLEKEDADARRS